MKIDYSYLEIEYLARFSGISFEQSDFRAFLESFVYNPKALDFMLSRFHNDKPLIFAISRKSTNMPCWIIEKHRDILIPVIKNISLYHRKTKRFIERFHDIIDWNEISICGNIYSYAEMDNCAKYLDWSLYCRHNDIPRCVVFRYSDYIDWNEYCEAVAKVPESVLVKFHDRIPWRTVCMQLTRPFVKRHHDIIDWNDIAENGRFNCGFYCRYGKYMKKSLVNKNSQINFRVGNINFRVD